MPKDARGEARREAQFYRSQVKCLSCGRPLSRRRGWTCSVKCQEKLEGSQAANHDQ
jgi:hypothetical protein